MSRRTGERWRASSNSAGGKKEQHQRAPGRIFAFGAGGDRQSPSSEEAAAMNPILLAKPQGGLRFFWNIDANVGAASPNIQDDVELIQFGYLLMSQAPAQPADLKAVFAQVKVGVPCTGS